MNIDYKTVALCEYFRRQPDGEYHPAIVREEMGISLSAWRQFTKFHLYPEYSRARDALSQLGVYIKTSKQPRIIEGRPLYISTFVKLTIDEAG